MYSHERDYDSDYEPSGTGFGYEAKIGARYFFNYFFIGGNIKQLNVDIDYSTDEWSSGWTGTHGGTSFSLELGWSF